MNSAQPVYLLAGGPGHRRKGPDPLLQEVFAQTGLARPSVAYIGVASDDDLDFLKWIAAYFRAAGSGPVRLAPMVSARADLAETRSILSDSDLVFISGGDVEAGMQRLRDRRMIPFLERLHAAGKPFFGLSAGSIMLAQGWVRWPDPQDDESAEAFPCLGFAPLLCDTHAETEDWEELKVLIKLSGRETVGYGIPTGGALCVSPEGGVSALGKPVPRFRAQTGAIGSLPPLTPVLS